jgi:hypothetical protein
MIQVEVRIEGRIDKRWSEWLHGLTVMYTDQDETVLVGPVEDQAALYGLLSKLRDLGLPLLSVNRISALDGTSRAP